MAFPPKLSTKIFHQNFFSTKHFQSVYSYSEYLSFAQFTWSSLEQEELASRPPCQSPCPIEGEGVRRFWEIPTFSFFLLEIVP